MANPEHLEILKQGVEALNEWMTKDWKINFRNRPKLDLSFAELCRTNLRNANLRGADLEGANLEGANLEGANLSDTNLRRANLNYANLNKAILDDAYLFKAKLVGSTLSGAQLSSAILANANLSNTDLKDTNFTTANLNGANLTDSDLTDATLNAASLINATLDRATITGACIQNWNITAGTLLTNIRCDFVYKRQSGGKFGLFVDRLPRDEDRLFKPGEFEALVRKQQDAVDLIFVEGIDWQAFFQSFQELRTQYQDDEITIQAIERKGEDFVIRLETTANSDGQKAIEASAKELYESRLRFLNEQVAFYKTELTVKRNEQRRADARLDNIVEKLATMAENQGPTYQTTIHANYLNAISTGSGNINNATQNIGANLDKITNLIQSLKTYSQAFPEEQKIDIEITIEDLESDLADETKRQPSRLAKRLLALWGAVCLISGGVAGVADFSNNVLELSEKLEVPFPVEIIQQNPHIPRTLPGG